MSDKLTQKKFREIAQKKTGGRADEKLSVNKYWPQGLNNFENKHLKNKPRKVNKKNPWDLKKVKLSLLYMMNWDIFKNLNEISQ